MATSCLKKQNLKEDLGAEFSAEQVQNTLASVWGSEDPHTMAVGEFASYEVTQNLQDAQTSVTGSKGYTVVKKTNSADNLDYNMEVAIQTEEIKDGQSKLSTDVVDFPVSKPLALDPGADAQSFSLLKNVQTYTAEEQLNLLTTSVLYQLYFMCSPQKDYKLSCHNVVVQEGVMTAPKKTVDAGHCKAGTDCKLNVKKISLDIVYHSAESEDEYEKVKVSAIITRDTPYLARVLQYCQRGLISVKENNQKVLVTLCKTNNDFKFGN